MTTEQTVFLEEILKGKNSLTIAELKKSKSGLKLFGLPAKPKDNDEIITAVQPALGSDFAFVKKGTEKNSTFLLVRQLQQTQKVKLVQESILKEVDKSKTGSYSPTTTFGKDLPMSQDDIVSILGNMIKSGGNESLQVVPKGKKNAFIRRLSQSEKEALILESLMKKTKPTIGFSPTKTFISGFPALFPNEVVEIFNQFLQTGRLVVSVDNSFKFSVQLVPDSAKNDSELFRAAFEKLDHGRIFVRTVTCDGNLVGKRNDSTKFCDGCVLRESSNCTLEMLLI
jgi:hypothetical protein